MRLFPHPDPSAFTTTDAQVVSYLNKTLARIVGDISRILNTNLKDVKDAGDLLLGNRYGELGVLGVGSNGKILVADSTADLGAAWGSPKLSIVNKTASYSVLSSDDIVRCDGTFTVNLPTATGSGRVLFIKNTGTGTTTVDGNGGTMDSNATVDLSANTTIMLCDSGSLTWDII